MAKRLIIKGADFSENGISVWNDITSRFEMSAGYTVKHADGTEGTSSAYQCNRTRVDISGFTKIKLLVPKTRTASPSAGIAFYSSSDSNASGFISGVAFNSDTSMASSTIEERTLDVPANATHIKVTYWADHSEYVDVWRDFKCLAK